MKYLAASRRFSHFFLRADLFWGIDDLAIDLFERQRGISLPIAYKEFLHLMGSDTGPLFRFDNIRFRELDQIRMNALALWKEKYPEAVELPAHIFPFLDNGEYAFLFMHLNQGENPPVYMLSEGEGISVGYHTFSEFVLSGFTNYYLHLIHLNQIPWIE